MISQAAKLDMIITKVIEATKRADALEARMDMQSATGEQLRQWVREGKLTAAQMAKILAVR